MLAALRPVKKMMAALRPVNILFVALGKKGCLSLTYAIFKD